MKNVLCFGDSNTYGYDPVTRTRFSMDQRWTGVLGNELGEEYHVIEEGLNGRTTVHNDPSASFRNGKKYLLPCLWSHAPLDLVIILLGTNDLKARICGRAADVASGADHLVFLAQTSGAGLGDGAPRVLLIAPPPLGKITLVPELWGFGEAEEESRKLGRFYRQVAELRGCDFVDAGEIVASSDIDGVHLEREEHSRLGKAVAALVRHILEDAVPA